jgi:predicted amidohydrolase YtcJ
MSTVSESIEADLLIRAKAVYTSIDDKSSVKAVAVRGGYIWALSEDPHGLDEWIGEKTKIIDEKEAAVFTTFDDTHTHLIFSALSQLEVPVHTADDISSMLALIKARAEVTPPGEWIATTTNWQEFNLREKRFPTIQELDKISQDHPIYVRRGGHNLVANSKALAAAGITTDTPSPPGGVIVRDKEGKLTGLLRDSPAFQVVGARPPLSVEQRKAGVELASMEYAATGIGCVRDCFVSLDDLAVLKAVHDEGKLHVRVRALIGAVGLKTVAAVEKLLLELEQWRHLQHDPYLSIWGLKFMIDGGIEAGATEEPYRIGPHDDPGAECCVPTEWRGALLQSPDEIVELMDTVVRRGWRIGTHAYGDRGVRMLLDVYENLLRRHPHLPPGTLVMEHGGLATKDQRERAVFLGIPVTIQQPLLHDVAAIQSQYWGKERTSHLFPAREWLDQGALVTGGSDFPVGKFGAMRSIWGMASRMTVTGVQGPEHAISVQEAIRLHTTLAVKLLKEQDHRGIIAPGRWADLTVFKTDPLEVGDVNELRDLLPLYTIVNGQIKHSP